jgi:tRNA(Ile)-lysidine synthase
LAELRDANAPGKIVAAHFNHCLRAAADHEAQFVADLAKRLHIACEVGQAAEPLHQNCDDGIEAAARDARYDFLLKTAEKVGGRYVATAHTADDQAETILHRVIRGTGLAGLSGIPRSRPLSPAVSLIRPLLDFSRADVVEYLSARQQPFCVDESNEDPNYTRNRIRHALLPQLAAQYNPNVRDALLSLGKLAGEAQQIVNKYTRDLVERTARVVSIDKVVVDCPSLQSEPRHLVRELFVMIWKQQGWSLQKMNAQNLDALADLVHMQPSAEASSRFVNLPGNIRAERADSTVVLIRNEVE